MTLSEKEMSRLYMAYVNTFPPVLHERIMVVWQSTASPEEDFDALRDGNWSFAVFPDTGERKWTPELVYEIVRPLQESLEFSIEPSHISETLSVRYRTFLITIFLLTVETRKKGEYYTAPNGTRVHTNHFRRVRGFPFYFARPKRLLGASSAKVGSPSRSIRSQ